jgi:acetyl-CoA carboxylase carboxyl transferase subunit alpha
MRKQETPSLKQSRLSLAWLKVQQTRHPKRPSPTDFIGGIFAGFSVIHGDRAYGDDEAVVCGMARLDSNQAMVIGIRKGTTLKERIKTDFAMPILRATVRCSDA